jgi:hypothetical protein
MALRGAFPGQALGRSLAVIGFVAAASGSGCRAGEATAPTVVAPTAVPREAEPVTHASTPAEAEVRAIPGDFDRFDASGATFAVLVPNRDAPSEVVVFDAARLTEVGRRTIRRGAVAWTYGGKVQVVDVGKAFERIDVDSGRRDAIDPALVAPGGETGGGGSISDDGKLFTFRELAVIDLDAKRVVFTLDPPCAGGPEPVVWVQPSGHFVGGSCRGTSWASIAGARSSHVAWQYSIADAYCVSADEHVMLEGPYQPFAREWVSDFVVRDVGGGRPLRTLPLAIADASRPYAMALSADGSLAAILLDGEIALYRTRDGTKIAVRQGPPNAVGARLAFRPPTGDLFASTRGALRVVRAP